VTAPDDPTAPETPEVDPAALAELHALFATLPPESMPDDVTARVTAALADVPPPRDEPRTEPAALGDSIHDSYGGHRRQRRTRQILAIAAALLIGVGGSIGLIKLAGSTSSSGTASSGAAARAGTQPLSATPDSGHAVLVVNFTATNLLAHAETLASSATSGTGYNGTAAAGCAPTGSATGLTLVGAEQGRYENRSVLLLVYQDPQTPHHFEAFLVPLPCAASGGAATLWQESFTR
jgi:hypothetical protein